MFKTTKAIGGLVSVIGFAAAMIGCSGGDSGTVDDSSSEDGTQPSSGGTGLPPKSETSKTTTPSAPSAPTGTPAKPPTDPNAPPADQGTPGQPGQAGTAICCYNNTAYDCPDQKSCLGGYDLDACQDACNGDFNCEIACVQKLSSVTGPTNACVKKGGC
jgi:hypothetical protein